ncbi:MAG: hypothetical protein ACKOZY_00280, partial [Flavobacteriales bacterium]
FCMFGTIAAIMFTGFFPGVLRVKKEIQSEEWRIQEEANGIVQIIQPIDTLEFSNSRDAILTNLCIDAPLQQVQMVNPTATGTSILRQGLRIKPLPQAE